MITVGGLVGYQGGSGSITASYATGAADGGGGDGDSVGGLVGQQREGGSITASYGDGEGGGGGGIMGGLRACSLTVRSRRATALASRGGG